MLVKNTQSASQASPGIGARRRKTIKQTQGGRGMLRKLTTTVLASAALAVAAGADTIATFDDPALDGSTPLFHFVSAAPGVGVLSGGWSATGLDLDAPGLVTTSFSDATFTMSNVAATGGPVFWNLGAGQI